MEEKPLTRKEQPSDHEKWLAKIEEERRNSVINAIMSLRKEALEKNAEADRLEALQKEFPDLVREVGRWNKVAFSSKTVNAHVEDYDLRHNCGCCNDSPLELWPYKKTAIGPVYSSPSKFIIGEKNYLGGDTPKPNWEGDLRSAGIPEAIITRVKTYFKQCRDDLIEQANELYEESESTETDPLL